MTRSERIILGVCGYAQFALMAFAVALLASSCIGPESVRPQFTQEELICIGRSHRTTATDIASCGSNVDGPCASKAIFDREKGRDDACLEKF